MRVTPWLATAWSALVPLAAWAQAPRPAPAPCPARPAECQVFTPVFNFGRHQMSADGAPIYSEGSVTVTCTKANGIGFAVDVNYDLMGLPGMPGRVMRDRDLGFLRYDFYVDPAHTQYWGDGEGGTKTFSEKLELNDANRVVTRSYPVYGMVYGQQVARPGQWLGFVSARLEYTIKRCR